MSKNILLMILKYFDLETEFFQVHFDFIDLSNHSLLQLSFILKDLLCNLLFSLHQAVLLYLIRFHHYFLDHSIHFIMIIILDFLQFLHFLLITLH